ncbi:MAG: imidazoleglycerol-phosphate dehydratase HisB [Desulfovibrionales bacterium]|mgnify:FL=1|nr:imidazoleglycerol-phosphate dehydratase HisB [Desulfovibrionales bacterium]
MDLRIGTMERETRETRISVRINLDGAGTTDIRTGFGFADHMLDLMGHWAGFDLRVTCAGDMHIDAHHSLEDVGLCLGSALVAALGDRRGIARVGSARVPMDEALTEVCLDLSGRPYLVYEESLLPPVIAGQEKDLWREFLKSLAVKGGMNLHVRMLYGQNGHHLLESVFKGLGLALRQAVRIEREDVLSTKGGLDACGICC